MVCVVLENITQHLQNSIFVMHAEVTQNLMLLNTIFLVLVVLCFPFNRLVISTKKH